VLAAGMTAATDNLAWQGPKNTWTGAALRPQRYEDNVTFDIAAASPAALQAILSAASGGLVLDFWVYVDRFLTYGRANMPMVALLGRDKTLFGLQVRHAHAVKASITARASSVLAMLYPLLLLAVKHLEQSLVEWRLSGSRQNIWLN
jgi:hypothetical protein